MNDGYRLDSLPLCAAIDGRYPFMENGFAARAEMRFLKGFTMRYNEGQECE